MFTNATRRGFAACVNLEEFTLTTEVSGVGYTKEADWHEVSNWIATTNPPDDSPFRAWQRIVLILSLLPSLTIHHLRLGLLLDACNIKHAHSLAWPEMRQALRRFTSLNVLEVIAEDLDDAEWDQCVAYELEEFKHVFKRDPNTSYCF